MNIKEFVKQVQQEQIDIVEHTEKVLEEAELITKKHHYLNTLSSDLARMQAKAIKKNPKGRLAGLPLTIKDGICVKGVESAAGSAILKGYKPLFNATVVQRLLDEGAIIIGKASQDEFGFGGFNVNVGVGYKVPTHPLDPLRVTGGSSGGCAGMTRKMTLMHASLGESTGGSIESPSALCGVVGVCPTYGTVSRYGLIDYANSLDKIGPMAKTVEDANFLWSLMIGKDHKDSTSIVTKCKKTKLKKAGVIRALVDSSDKEVQKSFADAEKKLSNAGVEVVDVELPITTDYAMQVYYVIALSEASTNLAKYCGMRYGVADPLKGSFNQYFSSIRAKYLGEEAKRRILLGTFARMAGYRDAFYIKAAQVRQKIIDEYKKTFKDCQVLISPTVPFLAPRREDLAKLTVLQLYAMDATTVGPNLAGIPHLSVPIGSQKNLPVGAMVMSDHFDEQVMFDAARILEK